MKRLVFGLMIAALLFSGCGAVEENKEVTPVATKELKEMTEARNSFTFNLMSAIYGEDNYENVAVSGLSAHIALGMVANGAVGSSRDEMMMALGMDSINARQMNDANNALITRKYGDDISLVTSNSVWVGKGTRIVDEFNSIVKNYYRAVTEKIDFREENAAKTVNSWVEKNTNGKIKEMVTQDEIKDAMMLILNALYLKAPWTNQFEEAATADEDFILFNGKPKKVKMMSREGFYKYHKGDGYQILRMPYGKNEDLAAYIVLPEALDGLITLSKIFTNRELGIELAKMQEKTMILHLPKFRFEFEADLIPTLKRLGMKAVFEATTSDLSAMIQPPPEAFISLIEHKTFIDVHEGGTEAAAITAVEMIAGAAPGEDEGPPMFLVDHPFMFLIRDEISGDVIFASCIAEP